MNENKRPTIVVESELPNPSPLAFVADQPAITDMEERVRQQYARWGLLQPGDTFALTKERIEVRYDNLVVGPIDPRKGEPVALHRVEFLNDTDRDQTTRYAESRKTTATLSVSVTMGFKYNLTLGGKIAIKKVLEVGEEQSFEFSLSSTASMSTSIEQQWTWEWPLVIPARSRVVATALVSTFHVEPSFHADLDISVAKHPSFDPGYNPLYVGITRKGETTAYRSSLESALNPWLGGGFSRGRDQNHVRYRCHGKFSGVYGRDRMIQVKQYPLGGGALINEQLITLPEGPAEAMSVMLARPEVEDRHASAGA